MNISQYLLVLLIYQSMVLEIKKKKIQAKNKNR